MTSRLTTRSDTPTAPATDRTSDRIVATKTIARKMQGKPCRTDHKSIRTAPRAAKADGVTMSYQQGFTSGPSM